MKKLFVLLLIGQFCFGQADGYWDKDRVTNQTILLKAGKRIAVKSEDFPVGTTEILYRITLLNENQELTSNLVSLLKSIPDPTGISQGSAGAVFLISKISGNDKCNYSIFTSDALVSSFAKTGDIKKACYRQLESINKDAKLLTLGKSSCLKENSQNVWFGFESKNWLMNQKIILEIVPWISNQKARGWTETNKKVVAKIIKNTDYDFKAMDSELLHVSILDKIERNYTYADFTMLQRVQQSKIILDFTAQIFKETNINDRIFTNIRADVAKYFKAQQFDVAIELLENTIMNYNNPTAQDYNQLAYLYIFTKQNAKALQILQKAEKLDAANISIQLNMAHVYLLSGQYAKAKNIYKKYKDQNVNATVSFKKQVLEDFAALEKVGINSKDFSDIIDKLNDN